ncbi:MAG: 7,8-didemethyl-8-hydroxy-5-deazariboflavin synthase subunit CofG [Thermodesulfobacteriota bacterium]
MAVENVTYSPSLTLPLTRACINHCLYCGFRKDGDGLLSRDAIERIVAKAHQENVSEILILSGEKADRTPEVRGDLNRLGRDSLVSWAKEVCGYLLDEGLLPHVNIGTLDTRSLTELKEVSASLGLMMEGTNLDVNMRIHPGKSLQERIRTIETAGRLRIPFTTGILLGVGETQRDRFTSILEIEQIQKQYGHIQEVILQRYIANSESRVIPGEIGLGEMKELVLFCRNHLPDVSIQIPPNLEPYWEELVSLGANDLGGIGRGKDLVNPESPWPEVDEITKKVARAGSMLRKRLPIYPHFYKAGWYSRRVAKVLTRWIEGDDEYNDYSKRGFQRQNPLS